MSSEEASSKASLKACPGLPTSPGRALLQSWLNRNMRIVLSDGRVLVGTFLCTDQDSNVILGSCTECPSEVEEAKRGIESRMLGELAIFLSMGRI